MIYTENAIELGRRIDAIRIHHTRFKVALDHIGRVIQLGSHLSSPPGITLIAPAGAGKSLVIDCIKNNVCNWPFLRAGNVICASLKESPSVSQIQDALLANFHYALPPRPTRSDNRVLSTILIEAIKQHKIQLIALDEFQHVFLSRKNDVHEAIIDWTKRLISQTRCPVLLSGTEKLRSFEEADRQITSRVPTIVSLPAFANDDEWKGILNAFAKDIKDVDLSRLATEFPTTIYKATQGSMRLLKLLLIECAMIAVDQKEHVVSREHLDTAFGRLFGSDTSLSNPFK